MRYIATISILLALASIHCTNSNLAKQDVILFADQKATNLIAFLMYVVRNSERIAMIGFQYHNSPNKIAITDFIRNCGIDLIDKLFFVKNPGEVIEPNKDAQTFITHLSNLASSRDKLVIVCLADIAEFMELVQDKVQFHPRSFAAMYALLSPDITPSGVAMNTSISLKPKKQWHLSGLRVVLIPSDYHHHHEDAPIKMYEESLESFASNLKRRIDEGLVLPGSPILFTHSQLFDHTVDNLAQSGALFLVAVLLTGADEDCQPLHQLRNKANFLEAVQALGGDGSTACIPRLSKIHILEDTLLLSLETFKFLPINGVYPQNQLSILNRNYIELLRILQKNIQALHHLQLHISKLGAMTLSKDEKVSYQLVQTRLKKLQEALVETERVMRSENAMNVIKSVTKLAEINRNIRAQKEKKLLQLEQKLEELTRGSDMEEFARRWDKINAKMQKDSHLEDEAIGSSHHAEF